jgi:hypothetical protein
MATAQKSRVLEGCFPLFTVMVRASVDSQRWSRQIETADLMEELSHKSAI